MGKPKRRKGESKRQATARLASERVVRTAQGVSKGAHMQHENENTAAGASGIPANAAPEEAPEVEETEVLNEGEEHVEATHEGSDAPPAVAEPEQQAPQQMAAPAQTEDVVGDPPTHENNG